MKHGPWWAPSATALIALALTAVACARAQAPAPRGDTIHVADRYFADTTTTGAEILAKFRTSPQRAEMLRLDAPIDSADGRRWLLEDILVSIDISANGYVATWRIAGPRRIVERYLDRVVALAKDRSVIYDHGIRRLVVKCACD